MTLLSRPCFHFKGLAFINTLAERERLCRNVGSTVPVQSGVCCWEDGDGGAGLLESSARRSAGAPAALGFGKGWLLRSCLRK